MDGEVKTVELEDVKVVKATDNALCLHINDEDIWCPRSAVADESEVFEQGDEGTITVARWWAFKNNLLT